MYKIVRNENYDFIDSSYASLYPNLHKYPATMLPQIGISLFKEFNIKANTLLDPYCGSGSSFTVGLNRGVNTMVGFDLNPLAVLISKAKFTKLDVSTLDMLRKRLRFNVYNYIKDEANLKKIKIPIFNNMDFWFSKNVVTSLAVIKKFILKIEDINCRRLFLLPFSETARECSYTRNNEFKLYRIKADDILSFNPDVYAIYFYKLHETLHLYTAYYLPLLEGKADISIYNTSLQKKIGDFDIVLTSPPYGDSSTTVAYGQFSFFGNHWLGIQNARKIDNVLMGGQKSKNLYNKGVMKDYILSIAKTSKKRALEVSSFYDDLEKSIQHVASCVSKNGLSIYIVGNRCVRGITLPTDQFIAEQFEEHGLHHIVTYERLIGNKSMPLKNSPSNIRGERVGTMTKEYIVICKK